MYFCKVKHTVFSCQIILRHCVKKGKNRNLKSNREARFVYKTGGFGILWGVKGGKGLVLTYRTKKAQWEERDPHVSHRK